MYKGGEVYIGEVSKEGSHVTRVLHASDSCVTGYDVTKVPRTTNAHAHDVQTETDVTL